MNGQERATDALENPGFPGHFGERARLFPRPTTSTYPERLVGGEIPPHQKLAESDRKDIEQALRREAGFGEITIAIGERSGGVKALAFGEPLEVAALAPQSEVDLRNGGAVELRAEDGLNLGQSVEPRDEFPAAFAFEKAQIKLFADFVGEICDFTVSRGHNGILNVAIILCLRNVSYHEGIRWSRKIGHLR